MTMNLISEQFSLLSIGLINFFIIQSDCFTNVTTVRLCNGQPCDKVLEPCGIGFIFIDGYCALVNNNITCPPGTTHKNGYCETVEITDLICPLNSRLHNGQCEQEMQATCLPGYIRKNGKCVGNNHYCDPGFELKDGSCQKITCPVNYIFSHNQCIPYTPQPPTPMPMPIPPINRCGQFCITGHFSSGGECNCQPAAPSPHPVCTYGIWNGFYCVDSREPRPGTTDEELNCLPGYMLVDYKCVKSVPPCPDGYKLVHHKCEKKKIVCPDDLIYLNGKCIKYICSGGLLWLNGRCTARNGGGAVGNDINNTIEIRNDVNNYNNLTHETNINLNNMNTIYIYGSDSSCVVNGTKTTCTSTPQTPPSTPEIPEHTPKCCMVITPRICHHTNKWRCYNRRYYRCGTFCIQEIIHLRPTRPIHKPPILVMPPITHHIPYCGGTGCVSDHIDCSGCMTDGFCSHECYDYTCPGPFCTYIEQTSFCHEYPGPGCFDWDGCYGDSCLMGH